MQQIPKALAKGLGNPLVEHPVHLGAQKTARPYFSSEHLREHQLWLRARLAALPVSPGQLKKYECQAAFLPTLLDRPI